ncbi:hypothetical protein DNK34_07880 [Pseudomonas dryadis]|uniref:Uncharacterized protein n=2 Tax=Pseudomonadales TaxID=72274 RepID=A0A4Q9QZV3_9GAMM|nr:hypothetical protein DNK44_13905 [Pseudomonas dryadis]TBV07621.1 hypothetical protein DNK34_07880 [Pseudomonas dryadis]TBV19952.1 hypothetical protein DNK41_00470 [Pseudomonas sp. FRB 230]
MTAMASHPSTSNSGDLPRLEVTAGVHRGVSLVLDEAVCSIGSDETSSLVLSDADVAERHLILRFSGRQVGVEACGGDVRVFRAGRETLLPRGHGYRGRLPLELRIGEARLSLAETARGAASANPVWYGKAQWGIAAAFMFICAGALAMLRDGPLLEAEPMRVQVAGELAEPEARTRGASLELARADLARQAEAAGLNNLQLSVSVGQLQASGTVEAGQEQDWVALQQYFDGRYGRQYVLRGDVHVRESAARPRLNFQAVWFGEKPYVINASGARLYPGAPLEGGWKIERIEAGQVVLALGAERFALTLESPQTPEG